MEEKNFHMEASCMEESSFPPANTYRYYRLLEDLRDDSDRVVAVLPYYNPEGLTMYC